jgi:hypothetical protein
VKFFMTNMLLHKKESWITELMWVALNLSI